MNPTRSCATYFAVVDINKKNDAASERWENMSSSGTENHGNKAMGTAMEQLRLRGVRGAKAVDLKCTRRIRDQRSTTDLKLKINKLGKMMHVITHSSVRAKRRFKLFQRLSR